MRLQRNRVREYPLFQCKTVVDEEAVTSEEYEQNGTIKGIRFQMQGKRHLEQPGEKDRYTICMKVDGAYSKEMNPDGEWMYKVKGVTFKTGDAILLSNAKLHKPDYKIRAILEQTSLMLELEMI